MDLLIVLMLGARVELVGNDEVATALASERKDAGPSVTMQSIGRRQTGIMNNQVLEIGAASDASSAAGARISIKDICQAQSGFGNDQRMSVGNVHD